MSKIKMEDQVSGITQYIMVFHIEKINHTTPVKGL